MGTPSRIYLVRWYDKIGNGYGIVIKSTFSD
jgi:hypothetical protein